jgi:hypothetical protein
MNCEIEDKIFDLTPDGFTQHALQLFEYQYKNNNVYHQYVNALGRMPASVKNITDIPFLPVRFFKSHTVKTGDFIPEQVFESSGTTTTINSNHYVKSLDLYRKSFRRGFEYFYGHPEKWCIIGLLPAYLERPNSSLVTMVDDLIQQSKHPMSGFYLYNYDELAQTLQLLEAAGTKTLLIGVTFALLDFAAAHPMPLKHTVVMETGGMKGRKREMIREEVHALLQQAFQIQQIHSEYGMSELLSQGYSKGEGVFDTVPWMKVLVREMEDPLTVSLSGKGLINVIDFANRDSCAFIATDDVGKLEENGSFEVNGRVDHSDLRGCSLLSV